LKRARFVDTMTVMEYVYFEGFWLLNELVVKYLELKDKKGVQK